MNDESCLSRTGEPDLLFRNVPVGTHEADQLGRSRGWGSWRLFPRVPRHAGGVALSQGQRESYFLSELYGSWIVTHSKFWHFGPDEASAVTAGAACLCPDCRSALTTCPLISTANHNRVSLWRLIKVQAPHFTVTSLLTHSWWCWHLFSTFSQIYAVCVCVCKQTKLHMVACNCCVTNKLSRPPGLEQHLDYSFVEQAC